MIKNAAQHCVYEVDFCSYIRALDDNLPENDIDITSAEEIVRLDREDT